jgi:hypothetical protein
MAGDPSMAINKTSLPAAPTYGDALRCLLGTSQRAEHMLARAHMAGGSCSFERLMGIGMKS